MVLNIISDIVILHETKENLHKIFNEIKEYLENILKLNIKKNYQVFPVKEQGIDGKKIGIKDILDKEIKVLGYKITESKYGKDGNDKCTTIQFELENENRVVFTGSSVLMNQCKKYENNMPFITKIKQVNNFYTFS